MRKFAGVSLACVMISAALFLGGFQGLVHSSAPFTLSVTLAGGGSGTVVSNPSAINCPPTCSATFQPGSQVALTATPDTGFTFTGWSGACTGTGSCNVNPDNGASVTATFGASLQSVNHIVFMVQENRGLDHYYGRMPQYRSKKVSPGTFDGLPQFNSPAGIVAINPGCDPAFPFQASPAPFNDCVTVVNGAIDPNSPQVPSQKLITQCVENPSPSWNESHVDWNVVDPLSATATMDGFVHTAAHDVRETQYIPGSTPPESDYDGVRAMGYYDQDVLPYYYFMASNFATSDRWFSPVMTRTQPNREYLMAATSLGHVYPPVSGAPQFTNKTIFEQLNDNNISWRIYLSDSGGSLQSHTELGVYTFASSQRANFVPASQLKTNIQNGNLPAGAEIDPEFKA